MAAGLRMLSRLPAGIATAVMLLVPAAGRADFTIMSQNTLHLGYGNSKVFNYINAKNAYLGASVVPTADLTLYQEVMAPVLANAAAFVPAGYNYYISPATKGFNGYREGYLFIYNPANITVHCHVSVPNAAMPNVIRPPDLLLVESKNHTLPVAFGGSPVLTWVVNFHAIWGKGVAQRLNEANVIANFAQTVAATPPVNAPLGCAAGDPRLNAAVNRVIVAGDWNLDAPTVAAQFGGGAIVAGPTGLTSLTPAGAPSSSYDHFVWSTANVNITATNIFAPAAGLPWFRTNISDHLGVTATVVD